MKTIDQRIVGIYTMSLLDNGIVQVHTSDEFPETIEGIKEATLLFGEMVNYKKTPILMTREAFAFPSTEVLSFSAQKDSLPYSSAEAHLLPSLALKIAGNFYLKINKPARPTKMFTDKNEAIEWLKQFL